MVSSDVVILTKAELQTIKDREYLRGVARGRFEESCDRSRNSEPPGKAGHSGAVVRHESAENGSAGRPTNPSADDPSHPWLV